MEVKQGYKLTEVGVIPEDWGVEKLSQLSSRIMVGIASSATHAYRASGVVMFRNQNIRPNQLEDNDILYIAPEYEARFKNKRLKTGDILTARTGYPGTSAMVPAEYEGAQSFTTLITRPLLSEVDPFFLCVYINSDKGKAFFDLAQAGGGQQNVNAGSLKHLPVVLPPKAEQHQITETLSEADALVESLEELLTKKRRIKHGAMQELLTGKKRLPGFSSEWEEKQIADCATPFIKRNDEREPLPVLTCSKHLGFVDSLRFFKNQVFSDDTTSYKLIRRGQIGYPANHIEEGSIGLQDLYDVAIVSPIYVVFEVRPTVNSFFLHRLLKLDLYKQRFSVATSSSVDRRGSLRWPEFSKILVALPSRQEQDAISDLLTDIENEVEALEEKLSKARQLKQVMMQELLTGRIRLV